MVRLIISGSTGRTGSRVVQLAREDSRFEIGGLLHSPPVDDSFLTTVGAVDVIVDFSTDEGAKRALMLSRSLQCPVLVATTGLSKSTSDLIDAVSEEVAVLVASNTSRGVAVLRCLVSDAVRLLPGATIEMVERHREGKRDAPSGTAKTLAADLEGIRPGIMPTERIHSVREGDIIGDHVVRFVMDDEVIEIGHSATSRDLFARGALDTAIWLAACPPGRYSIEDEASLAIGSGRLIDDGEA